jgi:hypothetical protein
LFVRREKAEALLRKRLIIAASVRYDSTMETGFYDDTR